MAKVATLMNFNYCFATVNNYFITFTALHRMQTRSSHDNSVCPPVCLSVCQTLGLRQNGKKICPDFYTICVYTIYLVFWEEEWVVGATPSTEILGQLAPIGAKSPVLNRYSPVAPQP